MKVTGGNSCMLGEATGWPGLGGRHQAAACKPTPLCLGELSEKWDSTLGQRKKL